MYNRIIAAGQAGHGEQAGGGPCVPLTFNPGCHKPVKLAAAAIGEKKLGSERNFN